ncbi:MAG TPA: penicillin acylase family protein [Anaerolineales bacterium]|nr:penicillin acylase family protein [Anaerolineales bacterium]
MLRILGRILLGLLALIVIAVLATAGTIYAAIDDSFPQTDGEIVLDGLDGQVEIFRDQAGIPHIYASTEHDLFFAEGYIHAQDRFWQMDFQRHVGAGRLSELLGSATLDTDIFLRSIGWERVARAELELLDPNSLAMLQAYAEGVNAYLADHQGSELSLEYLFLGLLNSNYQPAPWEPVNSLTWAKAMAWDLRDNMDNEIERAILLSSMSPERIEELFPTYPESHPIILPDYEFVSSESSLPPIPEAALPAELAQVFDRLSDQAAAADQWLGGDPAAELGSNSWVISGELSATGAPLLANDPHLDAGMPSIWYQVGLHCMPKGPDCSYETIGVSFVGVPGIVIGHNDRIAWGLTNVGADVMDLYIIKVNPENPNQYEMNGQWVDMTIVEENILVAGDETVDLPVRITEFGPIISESFGDLADFDQTSGLELPGSYAVALRWTALDPGNTLQSIFKINRAQNFDEFREAAREFVGPSQNLLYADVDGNIGYQMPGHIPLRNQSDGKYPVPGWTHEYAWQGYIPFEELPYGQNPESSYLVTANNAIVGADYPYLIADFWDYGYRAQRVVDLIEAAPGPIDIDYYQRMQGDSVNLGALEIIPALSSFDFADAKINSLRDQLLAWDGDQSIDSAEAALFNTFWKQLLKATFNDELPEAYWPSGNSLWYVVIDNLLSDPEDTWWDDVATNKLETRDEVLHDAFTAAVAELESSQGDDPSKWAWGQLHTITFVHQTMDNFPLIGSLFNRGPFPVSGGSAIVNATNWNAATGTFDVTSLPSKRSIVDLGNWENSLQINTTGQSGHAYHKHYIDLAGLWANVEYMPMHWDRAAIEAEAESHLFLMPAD